MQEYGDDGNPRSPYVELDENKQKIIEIYDEDGERTDEEIIYYELLTDNLLSFNYDEYSDGNWHWE